MAFDLSTAKPVGFDLSTAKPVQPEPPAPGNRGNELFSGVNEGIARIVGLPVDAVTNILNLGLAAYGTARTAGGNPGAAPNPIANPVFGSEWIGNMLDKAGIKRPQPTDATGRILQRTGQEIGASAVPASRVGTIADVAIPAAVSAGTGLLAGTGREIGGTAGEVLGQAAGVAGPSALAAGARGAVRKGDVGAANMKANIDTFNSAGANPSVGQASGNRLFQAAESGLSKIPGGAGPMSAAADKQASDLSNRVGDISAGVSTKAGQETAGRAIKEGITGPSGFIQRFKDQSNFLYDKLDKFIPKDTRVDISSTRGILERLNSDIPGAPNTSEFFKNSKIKGIEGALKADTETPAGVLSQMPPIQRALLEQLPPIERTAMAAQIMDGKLPYEALKKLRTLVGGEIANSTIASDVPRSKWKALYGALSSDLENAATQAGPEATSAFNRANSYHSAGSQRIENTLDSIVNKGDPEKIYNAVISGASEGATTIRGVKRSLQPDEWSIVQSTVIDRLGKATPGKQNAEGDQFSSQTFLTNWNRLSPSAKTELFAGGNQRVRHDLDDIAKAAEKVKQAGGVFANPSGTTQAAANISAGTGLAVAAGTGNYTLAASILGGVVAANLSARTLTNPKVTNWLAEATQLSPKEYEAHYKRLYTSMTNSTGSDRSSLEQLYNAVK